MAYVDSLLRPEDDRGVRVTQWLLVWTGHQVGAHAGPWNAHLFNLEKGGGGEAGLPDVILNYDSVPQHDGDSKLSPVIELEN